MANIRPLFSLAELAAQRSLRPSSSLAIAYRNYRCCCQSSLSQKNTFNTIQSHPVPSAHRSYSATSSMLSGSSPFRLTSTPKQHADTPAAAVEEEVEIEEEDEGYYSPYKPKRQWPPDMSKLSPKHQLRLERKYRRRAALKYARPRWVKATKLVQWGVIIFVVIYSVLFMEWGKEGEEHPFEDVSDLFYILTSPVPEDFLLAEFRKDFFASFNSLFSTPPPPRRKE
ncbi:hypothetical protein UA08_04726 [Talaromyces atroroseus]|uniref:Uncharacterized protein n=1 Tax=Talaromyces atroroseus TaxID=1441469 RepID=A0A225ARC4_TALAT|nr:hypothetical protein UA08_04726 [Talaromyces atroroseus]OKL59828.1 hypothetical protein UA08_04726 [Talaromyces atroroseus]